MNALPYIALAVSALGVLVGLFGPILTVLGMWLANRVESAKTQATFAEQIGGVRLAVNEVTKAHADLSKQVQETLTTTAVSQRRHAEHDATAEKLSHRIEELAAAMVREHDAAKADRHAFRAEMNDAMRSLETRVLSPFVPQRRKAA